MIQAIRDIKTELDMLGAKAEEKQKMLHLLISALVDHRHELRQQKRWQEADKIRNMLNSIGIEVVDGTNSSYPTYTDIPSNLKGQRGDSWYYQKLKGAQLLDKLRENEHF